MELEIKYGVFLKDKDNPEEWRIFAGWFSKYEDAYAVYNDLKSNISCLRRKIVESVTTYEDVAMCENQHLNEGNYVLKQEAGSSH